MSNTVHLINPSTTAFGTAVITPRWLYVLAGATPRSWGDPNLIDETLELSVPSTFHPGDIVGIGIHTGNALRGYELGRAARARGAVVVFGGIHASLYPEEARELGGAHSVVRGDGEGVWPRVLEDCQVGRLARVYDGGQVHGTGFVEARWDLLPRDRYMWASVQTVRGCPKHCSFCSVWRTDGQEPRTRPADAVVREVVELRRMGFRFIALADDNFYPVTLKDLEVARKRANPAGYARLAAIREERFELLRRLARLPADLIFFTQVTMEAAEDPTFLDAMRQARIVGALVGIESATAEGLHSIYKDFNLAGDALVERLRTFRAHGIHVLGSFIFGLPTDREGTFDATLDLATRADLTFAQFVTLTPFPGTVDFARWEASVRGCEPRVQDVPITRHWLIPDEFKPKLYMPHPTMSAEEMRQHTQRVWDRFYSIGPIWRRARCVKSLRARLAFVLISKLYRQMYANTGIATDSARITHASRWARRLARPCRRLFAARPMPELQVPA
jgi:tRNA A37 methylthiotransferase MiaB